MSCCSPCWAPRTLPSLPSLPCTEPRGLWQDLFPGSFSAISGNSWAQFLELCCSAGKVLALFQRIPIPSSIPKLPAGHQGRKKIIKAGIKTNCLWKSLANWNAPSAPAWAIKLVFNWEEKAITEKSGCCWKLSMVASFLSLQGSWAWFRSASIHKDIIIGCKPQELCHLKLNWGGKRIKHTFISYKNVAEDAPAHCRGVVTFKGQTVKNWWLEQPGVYPKENQAGKSR